MYIKLIKIIKRRKHYKVLRKKLVKERQLSLETSVRKLLYEKNIKNIEYYRTKRELRTSYTKCLYLKT